MKNTKVEGRVMPHSIEGEQSVLGCVLIDQDAGFNILSALNSDDFYVEAHKLIFNAMYEVYKKNSPVDLITLTDELEKSDLLESVGGLEYITTLTNIVPSASNYKHYIDIVKRDSVLRKLITKSNEIINFAYEGHEKTDAIAMAEKNIFDIGREEERGELSPINEALDGVMDKFEVIQKDKSSLRGISTGIYGLDKITNGLQNSDLILVAGRPGSGKTSLAMNIVNYAAIHGKKKCAIFSLEMPKIQLAQRSLCSVAYVSMEKALKGELSVKDWKALWSAKEKLGSADIFADDNSMTTPMDILSKCRKLKREHGLDLVMIDYLQLMTGNSKNAESRQQEVSSMSRNLKIAAKELNVPIILLSQLSRGVESRTDHRPMLSDLRESGAIEQDADIVIFVYRPDMYKDCPKEIAGQNLAEIIVAKHRNGPQGTVNVKWIGETTTFVNLEKDANSQSLEGTEPPEPNKVTMPDENLPDIVPLEESDIVDDIF